MNVFNPENLRNCKMMRFELKVSFNYINYIKSSTARQYSLHKTSIDGASYMVRFKSDFFYYYRHGSLQTKLNERNIYYFEDQHIWLKSSKKSHIEFNYI